MEIEMSQMDWVSAPIPDNLGAPRHAPTLVAWKNGQAKDKKSEFMNE